MSQPQCRQDMEHDRGDGDIPGCLELRRDAGWPLQDMNCFCHWSSVLAKGACLQCGEASKCPGYLDLS